MDAVNLQFTQADRDLLMSMDQKLDQLTQANSDHRRRLASHHRRLRNLESLRDEGKGLARALRWAWAGLIALASLFGWHIAQKP